MHKCIFCHKDVSISKSVEHIIPESLGNKSHVLPKGYVCDECNNYFARKVEKELLAMPYFISMRSRNNILSKKGTVHFEVVSADTSWWNPTIPSFGNELA